MLWYFCFLRITLGRKFSLKKVSCNSLKHRAWLPFVPYFAFLDISETSALITMLRCLLKNLENNFRTANIGFVYVALNKVRLTSSMENTQLMPMIRVER